MIKEVLPTNAIQLLDSDGEPRDDTGRHVIVNSIGGPSWPNDVWKRALEKVGGTVVWGPCKLWYVMPAKVKGQKLRPDQRPVLKPQKFETQPTWMVRLGNGLEIGFVEQELTFS